jgi:hypothetical protein
MVLTNAAHVSDGKVKEEAGCKERKNGETQVQRRGGEGKEVMAEITKERRRIG